MPRLIRLEVDNVMHIEHRVFEPGAAHFITGPNGSGKTSFLESVRFALLGGTDISLIRSGAEQARVLGVWDNGMTILRSLSAKTGQKVTLEMPVDGAKVTTSSLREVRAYMERLIGTELAADPLALLHCPEAQQAAYLADLISPEVTDTELREASGIPVPRSLPRAGLERIAAVRKLVYEERTGINRTASDAATLAEQLRSTLPPEDPEAPDPSELRLQKAEIEARLHREEKDAAAEEEKDLAAIRERAQAQLDAARSDAAYHIRELEEQIRGIERDREKAAQSIKDQAQAEFAKRKSETADAAKARATAAVPELEQLTVSITRAEAVAEERVRARTTLQTIASAEARAAAARTRSKELSGALSRLDVLKEAKLAELPIPGLEIRDGAVYYRDLPFRRVNTAERVRVSALASIRKGAKGGLVIVDGVEALDPGNRDALVETLLEAGYQVIGAERTDAEAAKSEPTEAAA